MLLGTIVAENLIGTLMWVLLVVGIGIFLPLPLYAWIASLAIGAVAALIVGSRWLTATGHSRCRGCPPDRWFAKAAPCRIMRLWGAVRESHLVLREPGQFAIVGGSDACLPGSRSGRGSTSRSRRSGSATSAGAAPACCW